MIYTGEGKKLSKTVNMFKALPHGCGLQCQYSRLCGFCCTVILRFCLRLLRLNRYERKPQECEAKSLLRYQVGQALSFLFNITVFQISNIFFKSHLMWRIESMLSQYVNEIMCTVYTVRYRKSECGFKVFPFHI